MDTDNILREWAMHNWEIHRAKYTGEIVKFGKNAKGNFQNFRPKKPIRILSVNSMIVFLQLSEIPKLKNEIEDDEIERAKADSDPILALKIERNKALVAMLQGFCNGKTEEAAIKALEEYIPGKVNQDSQEIKQKRKVKAVKEEHTLLFLKALQDCDQKLKKKKSTPNQIWEHLKDNLRDKYDPDETIINNMNSLQMLIRKSSGNDESIDSESFARAIRRLRKEKSN